MEEHLIIDVWDTFEQYIPEKQKTTAAEQYVEFLVGQEVELDVLEGLMGYDPNLDDAIKLAVTSSEQTDEDEEAEVDEEYEDAVWDDEDN